MEAVRLRHAEEEESSRWSPSQLVRCLASRRNLPPVNLPQQGPPFRRQFSPHFVRRHRKVVPLSVSLSLCLWSCSMVSIGFEVRKRATPTTPPEIGMDTSSGGKKPEERQASASQRARKLNINATALSTRAGARALSLSVCPFLSQVSSMPTPIVLLGASDL